MWIANIGEWSDSIKWDKATEAWLHDNGVVGPFETQADAVLWLRQHSMSLGTDEENNPPLPDEEYFQYTHQVDPPGAWVQVKIGDQPGEFTPEGAADLVGDVIKMNEEKRA